MLTIQHDSKEYVAGVLIPIDMATTLESLSMKFVLRFHCRSGCQTGAPLYLHFGVYTQNTKLTPQEEVFGVPQYEATNLYPVHIQ